MKDKKVCKNNLCSGCTESCCIGDYGTFLTLQDVKRISAYTGLAPGQFSEYGNICDDPDGQKELMEEKSHSYFEYTSSGKILKIKSKHDKRCIFLENNACQIRPVRPLICRIFPLGFRKNNGKITLFIEQEDSYCRVAEKNSVPDILKFLELTEKEARQLITLFLDEVEGYKNAEKKNEIKNIFNQKLIPKNY
jgi:Fe-S-cluster containining protein